MKCEVKYRGETLKDVQLRQLQRIKKLRKELKKVERLVKDEMKEPGDVNLKCTCCKKELKKRRQTDYYTYACTTLGCENAGRGWRRKDELW